MSTEYRSWEQREADAALTRAQADKLRADAKQADQAAQAGAAETNTKQLTEQVKQAKLAKQLKAVEQEDADADEERTEKRREERLEKGVWFKRVVTLVVVLGLLAALPAQIAYFLGLRAEGHTDAGPSLYLAPIPFFLELLAWAGVLGTQWAHRKGFARWPFWLMTALLAGFAGYINGAKGTALFGPIAGIALAATSIIGPILWEVREVIEARTAGDNRTAAERAGEKTKERMKRAEKQAERKRLDAQDKQRKGLFPEEWKQYERILAAHPEGAITREQAWDDARRAVQFPPVWERFVKLLAADPVGARSRSDVWAAAWHSVYRLPVGTTAETLAIEVTAERAVEKVLTDAERTPERYAVDRFLGELFPPTGGDDGAPGGTFGGRSPNGPQNGGDGAYRGFPKETPAVATPLVGKGNKSTERQPEESPERPLDEDDLNKVRALADALGDATKLSARNVRETVGCRNEYAVRLRDAVKAERRTDSPE